MAANRSWREMALGLRITSFVGDNAQQSAEDHIFDFEKKTLSSFSKVKAKKFEIPARSEMGRKKMFWEEHSSKELPLAFNGVPFFILGGQVRECCHGPDRHRAEKHKAIKQKKAADHDYVQQTLQFVQTTTKMNCPAAIHLRSVVAFPSYRIENDSNWGRRKQVKVLRSDLLDPEKEIFWEHHVFVALPAPGAHRNHLTNEIGCLVHKVDKIVIKKIHSLVADGVRDVAEMRRHVTSFSKTNFPGLPETSNKFYPNNRCLRNHMYAALSLSQFSTEDQENLQQHVNKWRNERPDDHFHFVPSPKEEAFDHEDFIFVHQTAWQKRLLSLYGNEICLLDATYCVCKCDVALFLAHLSRRLTVSYCDHSPSVVRRLSGVRPASVRRPSVNNCFKRHLL